MSQQAPKGQVSSGRSSSTPTPNRRNARTYTLVGLFALFVVAVVVILLGKAVPDRFSRQLERLVHRGR